MNDNSIIDALNSSRCKEPSRARAQHAPRASASDHQVPSGDRQHSTVELPSQPSRQRIVANHPLLLLPVAIVLPVRWDSRMPLLGVTRTASPRPSRALLYPRRQRRGGNRRRQTCSVRRHGRLDTRRRGAWRVLRRRREAEVVVRLPGREVRGCGISLSRRGWIGVDGEDDSCLMNMQ
ncbi:hypothetical protein VFPBJ_05396 [Purpureocillium lilacinum]|uniref:Uncharacterized protein n=1 Tax=Purpureocillium lilacinum TaxID=33203 RepID=A0A179GRA5_PURLI|nr:hypothetical protein VFPBJ_05396 [Purpureocillium lilacinum]